MPGSVYPGFEMMSIESVREFAMTLNPDVVENLFAKDWISFSICGKWFLLVQIDAPEPRVAVKMAPDDALRLREENDGVQPAFHMNKKTWSDLYLDSLNATFVQECITDSFKLVVSTLPKKYRDKLL